MTRQIITGILCLLVFFATTISTVAEDEKKKTYTIQIAVLLDTSNSMDGLIHQAKTQLWNIVNELATAKKNGVIPQLQVALYEYGNDSLSAENGYVRRVLPLTTDLDKVSEELFALKTNGGTEYCGWVIDKAVKELKWSESDKDFKAIYIAGNESFAQMPGGNTRVSINLYSRNQNRNNVQQQAQQQIQVQKVPNVPNNPPQNNVAKNVEKSEKPEKLKDIDYRVSCKKAISKGIVVNTIHCGDYQTGINGKWRDGATLADGIYMNIDQNRKVIDIKAPQDKKILELNQKLNSTYIAYGSGGSKGKERQMMQDKMAKKSSYSGNIQRAMSKASVHYRNTAWDLVDANREGKLDLEKVKTEDLPEEMRKMTIEERKAYVDSLLKKRTEIQKTIKTLMDARKKYVAEKMREQSGGKDTLETAITKTLHEQLQKKDYTFDKK
ncbi:hypothetical protein [Candidatus Uabimicrobium amorphum]|uniref:VWFA domain-containing protein n=1 Tax=Uabimicrobium amorphum TaxID=2596890 RepID=A0A5S9F2I1_UABAM|nr:hypothetical protein [Candidatus Uabimicrobium amorphum]BBM82414.1 hypothetical protein UABAM_00757 [Candidatus Uabimicrobium amorphum]